MTVCMFLKRTWYGYECKFSDFNSEYAEGDAINLTIKFNKEVQSQVGVNIDGGFSTISVNRKRSYQNHLYLTMTT